MQIKLRLDCFVIFLQRRKKPGICRFIVLKNFVKDIGIHTGSDIGHLGNQGLKIAFDAILALFCLLCGFTAGARNGFYLFFDFGDDGVQLVPHGQGNLVAAPISQPGSGDNALFKGHRADLHPHDVAD